MFIRRSRVKLGKSKKKNNRRSTTHEVLSELHVRSLTCLISDYQVYTDISSQFMENTVYLDIPYLLLLNVDTDRFINITF